MSRRYDKFSGWPNSLKQSTRHGSHSPSLHLPAASRTLDGHSSAASNLQRWGTSQPSRSSSSLIFRAHSTQLAQVEVWMQNQQQRSSSSQQPTRHVTYTRPSNQTIHPDYYEEEEDFYGTEAYDRKTFGKKLWLTLRSEKDGFKEPCLILKKLWDTYQIDGNEVAMRNKFVLFEQLLKSEKFANEVSYERDNNEVWTFNYSEAQSEKYEAECRAIQPGIDNMKY